MDARGVQEAKRQGATTIAIGTHVSAVPGNTLELIPELDCVIRHEPEQTFREIVDRVCAGQALDGCRAWRTATRPARSSSRRSPALKTSTNYPSPGSTCCRSTATRCRSWATATSGC